MPIKMVSYYGDFAEDDTVNIPFNTFSSNDPSASVTATDLIASDIYVHKDGSATPITTDGATIDIDAPGVGAHMITIDTSVHADYAVGSEYAVRIDGVTVDAGAINAWVGAFSIERAGGVLALLKGTNSLANIEDKIDIIDTNVDDVETDLANATDGLGALKTLIDALNDITVANVLTTQMTESYATNGTAPTLAQAIFAIHQVLMDHSISGTAQTVEKLGGTTAFTMTLNNATTPTGVNRA